MERKKCIYIYDVYFASDVGRATRVGMTFSLFSFSHIETLREGSVSNLRQRERS